MNIVCDKTLLSAAIDGVSKAVTMRSSIPVLEGILLKAEGFQLTLTGYDLEMSIVTTIEANIKEPGEIVLNAKLLSSMISRMPAGQISIVAADNGKTTIQSGVAQFEIQSMPATDFPDLPNTGAEQTLTIKTGVLRDMIDRTLYAVSQDEKKPAHTGELFEIELDKLTIVALDGYRLALRTAPIVNNGTEEKEIVVPARSLIEVARILPDDGEKATITFSRTHLSATGGDVKIIARLMEGDFIKYKQILPNEHMTRVRVNRKELLDGIERVALMARESKSNLIKFSISREMIEISANSEIGRSNEEIPCAAMGEDIEIAFNNKYLTDVFKVLDDEEIYMDFNSNVSPCVVKPINGDEYYYLILPVRLFTGA